VTAHVTKPLKRRTDARVQDQGSRRLIVTLYPDGCIGLRPERTRREETVSLSACWQMAVRQRVAYERAQKKAAKRKG